MLDLPPNHTSSTQQEEDDEEITLHDPTETQEVFARAQEHTIKFGDDGNLIKASIVDVDCSK